MHRNHKKVVILGIWRGLDSPRSHYHILTTKTVNFSFCQILLNLQIWQVLISSLWFPHSLKKHTMFMWFIIMKDPTCNLVSFKMDNTYFTISRFTLRSRFTVFSAWGRGGWFQQKLGGDSTVIKVTEWIHSSSHCKG